MNLNDMSKEEILGLLAKQHAESREKEERLIGKAETLLDELILLTRTARETLQRYKPFDWTLLYGPGGTEIRRPNE
jgi:hypothetical protein